MLALKKDSFIYRSSNKRLDIDFVKGLFSDRVQIETYIQHFNLTDPFENFKLMSSDLNYDVIFFEFFFKYLIKMNLKN
jgi:hypothetical protein